MHGFQYTGCKRDVALRGSGHTLTNDLPQAKWNHIFLTVTQVNL